MKNRRAVGDLKDRLLEWVDAHCPTPYSWIFPGSRNPEQPMWRHQVYDYLHAAARAVGFDSEGLGPHTFRRAAPGNNTLCCIRGGLNESIELGEVRLTQTPGPQIIVALELDGLALVAFRNHFRATPQPPANKSKTGENRSWRRYVDAN